MYVEIFAEFDKKIKKVIEPDMYGYVMPVMVLYGFTNDRILDNDTIWYNLKGKPGNEVSNFFYKKIMEKNIPK
jgi:hypothetical protein